MFEKIARRVEDAVAEPVLSRRGVMSTMGRSAVGFAGLLGALLARPQKASANAEIQACFGICQQQCVSLPGDMNCLQSCMMSCLG